MNRTIFLTCFTSGRETAEWWGFKIRVRVKVEFGLSSLAIFSIQDYFIFIILQDLKRKLGQSHPLNYIIISIAKELQIVCFQNQPLNIRPNLRCHSQIFLPMPHPIHRSERDFSQKKIHK